MSQTKRASLHLTIPKAEVKASVLPRHLISDYVMKSVGVFDLRSDYDSLIITIEIK